MLKYSFVEYWEVFFEENNIELVKYFGVLIVKIRKYYKENEGEKSS